MRKPAVKCPKCKVELIKTYRNGVDKSRDIWSCPNCDEEFQRGDKVGL